jgi:hypothetical protein
LLVFDHFVLGSDISSQKGSQLSSADTHKRDFENVNYLQERVGIDTSSSEYPHANFISCLDVENVMDKKLLQKKYFLDADSTSHSEKPLNNMVPTLKTSDIKEEIDVNNPSIIPVTNFAAPPCAPPPLFDLSAFTDPLPFTSQNAVVKSVNTKILSQGAVSPLSTGSSSPPIPPSSSAWLDIDKKVVKKVNRNEDVKRKDIMGKHPEEHDCLNNRVNIDEKEVREYDENKKSEESLKQEKQVRSSSMNIVNLNKSKDISGCFTEIILPDLSQSCNEKCHEQLSQVATSWDGFYTFFYFLF